jgi:hypothetical protein
MSATAIKEVPALPYSASLTGVAMTPPIKILAGSGPKLLPVTVMIVLLPDLAQS